MLQRNDSKAAAPTACVMLRSLIQDVAAPLLFAAAAVPQPMPLRASQQET